MKDTKIIPKLIYSAHRNRQTIASKGIIRKLKDILAADVFSVDSRFSLLLFMSELLPYISENFPQFNLENLLDAFVASEMNNSKIREEICRMVANNDSKVRESFLSYHPCDTTDTYGDKPNRTESTIFEILETFDTPESDFLTSTIVNLQLDDKLVQWYLNVYLSIERTNFAVSFKLMSPGLEKFVTHSNLDTFTYISLLKIPLFDASPALIGAIATKFEDNNEYLQDLKSQNAKYVFKNYHFRFKDNDVNRINSMLHLIGSLIKIQPLLEVLLDNDISILSDLIKLCEIDAEFDFNVWLAINLLYTNSFALSEHYLTQLSQLASRSNLTSLIFSHGLVEGKLAEQHDHCLETLVFLDLKLTPAISERLCKAMLISTASSNTTVYDRLIILATHLIIAGPYESPCINIISSLLELFKRCYPSNKTRDLGKLLNMIVRTNSTILWTKLGSASFWDRSHHYYKLFDCTEPHQLKMVGAIKQMVSRMS